MDTNNKCKLDNLGLDHVFNINTGPYRQDIMFMYGNLDDVEPEAFKVVHVDYHKKLRKIMKSFRKEKKFSGLYHISHPIRIIYMTPQENLTDFMQVLSHEALHAVIEILNYVQIPLGRKSEEAYTYLLGSIIDQIVYYTFDHEVQLTESEILDKELMQDIGVEEKDPNREERDLMKEIFKTTTTADAGPR